MPPQYPIQTAVLQGMHHPLVFQVEAELGLQCGGRVFLIMNEDLCLILRTKKTNVAKENLDVRFAHLQSQHLGGWDKGIRSLRPTWVTWRPNKPNNQTSKELRFDHPIRSHSHPNGFQPKGCIFLKLSMERSLWQQLWADLRRPADFMCP